MTVLDLLASAQGRRDEVPNQKLAQAIAAKNSKQAVAELVAHLRHKSTAVQNDCIKVLYEIGERKPGLIAPYIQNFLSLLKSKNNRLQWGAMTALDAATLQNPKAIFSEIRKIMLAADQGSVITRDHAVNILIKLCSIKAHAATAFGLLFSQLERCPTNQFPMYAEKALPVIGPKNQPAFVKVLTRRLGELPKPSQVRRVEAILRKCEKVSLTRGQSGRAG